MNWKTEAMDRLRQYEASRSADKCLRLDIQRLEESLCSPGSAGLEMPTKKSVDYEQVRLNRLVALQLTRQRLEQNRLWLEAADTALAALTPEEKLLLHRLYISPRKNAVEELCQTLNTERSTVYRKRDKALEAFTLALFGIAQ